ncbi:MAG TPA: HU family DNA-binding protein [Gemmataceae bacterium]
MAKSKASNSKKAAKPKAKAAPARGAGKSKAVAAAPDKPLAKSTLTDKPKSKSGLYQALADRTGLKRQQIAFVFDQLTEVIKEDLGPKGPGKLMLPMGIKLERVHKPAQPERKGIDPFTKQEKIFKAKPARTEIKARALKALRTLPAQK